MSGRIGLHVVYYRYAKTGASVNVFVLRQAVSSNFASLNLQTPLLLILDSVLLFTSKFEFCDSPKRFHFLGVISSSAGDV
jgi:hypothetical protein